MKRWLKEAWYQFLWWGHTDHSDVYKMEPWELLAEYRRLTAPGTPRDDERDERIEVCLRCLGCHCVNLLERIRDEREAP